MRHPTEGVLRQLLDEPAGVADTNREHVVGCPRCLGGLAAAREDAALVDEALATEGGVDVDAAWRRLSTAALPAGPLRTTAPARAGRSRAALRRPAVAALAVAVFMSGAAAAAANDWLQIFRTEQIAPVSLSTADLIALPDLSAYGDVAVTGDVDVHQVPDAAAAEAETGLDVPDVTTLPRGVSGEPVFQVGGEASATFTFSADRAAQSAAESGTTLPRPPPGLDGSQVRLDAGPGVAQIWGPPPGCPPSSWVAPSRQRPSPPASRSRRRATTCSRCPACPTTSRLSCVRSPPTAPPCRCPCPPTRSPRRRRR